MAFAFDFSGDDIDESVMPVRAVNIEINGPPMEDVEAPPPEVPVVKHDVREMV